MSDAMYEFNYQPEVDNIDEFVEKFVVDNPHLNHDGCAKLVTDIKKNSTFWKWYLGKPKQRFTGFTFIQNYKFFARLYFDEGKSAEAILKELPPGVPIANVESIRRYTKQLLRARTSDEKITQHCFHRAKTGQHNARPDLWGFEDEVIRLYKDGMSAERIAKEFNCSADHIRDTLCDSDAYTPFNIAKVYRITHEALVDMRSQFSDEKLADIRQRTRDTRIKNNSNAKSQAAYKATLAKKYGNHVTNVSQVPEIHNKQQRYRYYEYTCKTGEIVKIQGYERFALTELERTYSYSDLALRETFKYRNLYTNKICTYYADVLVRPTNLIVEVKSLWTIKKYAEKNRSILHYMLTNGKDFEFWIYTDKGVKTVVKTLEEFDNCVGNCFIEDLTSTI